MSETMMKASGTSEPVIFLESSTAVAGLQWGPAWGTNVSRTLT
jgi:hypothetical protein